MPFKDSDAQKQNSPRVNITLWLRVHSEEMGKITNFPLDNYDSISGKHALLILKNNTHSLVTHLSTVQVLMFLQEFIRLLYCHFIVAIIEVIWGSVTESCYLINNKHKNLNITLYFMSSPQIAVLWGVCACSHNHTNQASLFRQLPAKMNHQPLSQSKLSF